MVARQKFYQRKYLINKKFQLRFILFYIVSLLLVLGLSSWYMFFQVKSAVEKHLYSTHLKVGKVGDFLFDLMFVSNFSLILLIVLIVIGSSLLVFQRINKKFMQIDAQILKMAQGDFSAPAGGKKNFLGSVELSNVVNRTRGACQARLTELNQALNEIEQGSLQKNSGLLQSGKKKLDGALADLNLQ